MCGGAGSGAQHRHRIAVALGDQAVVEVGIGRQGRLALGVEGVDGDQARIVVFAHAARVGIDDVPDRRHPVAEAQDLVDLLLVLGHHQLGAGMGHQIGDLLVQGVAIHAQAQWRRPRGRQSRPSPSRVGCRRSARPRRPFPAPEREWRRRRRGCGALYSPQVMVFQMPKSFTRSAMSSGQPAALCASSLGRVSSAATSGSCGDCAAIRRRRPVDRRRSGRPGAGLPRAMLRLRRGRPSMCPPWRRCVILGPALSGISVVAGRGGWRQCPCPRLGASERSVRPAGIHWPWPAIRQS